MNNSKLKEMIYDEIAEKVIMKYQQLDSARIDEVIISNQPIDDEV